MSIKQCDFTTLYCPDFMPAVRLIVNQSKHGELLHIVTKERSALSDIQKYCLYIEKSHLIKHSKQASVHHFMLKVIGGNNEREAS